MFGVSLGSFGVLGRVSRVFFDFLLAHFIYISMFLLVPEWQQRPWPPTQKGGRRTGRSPLNKIIYIYICIYIAVARESSTFLRFSGKIDASRHWSRARGITRFELYKVSRSRVPGRAGPVTGGLFINGPIGGLFINGPEIVDVSTLRCPMLGLETDHDRPDSLCCAACIKNQPWRLRSG